LAFSVAAHLEPEILLIDEVWAVGDISFQKKSVGNITDVASQGRTVMFVSHNLATVMALCTRGFLLESGRGIANGSTEEVISTYLNFLDGNKQTPLRKRKDRTGNGKLRFFSTKIVDRKGNPVENVTSGQTISFSFEYALSEEGLSGSINIGLQIIGNLGQHMFQCGTDLVGKDYAHLPKNGIVSCEVPGLPLPPGNYSLSLWAVSNYDLLDSVENAMSFTVYEGDYFGSGKLPYSNFRGVLVPHTWHAVQEISPENVHHV